jgi:hypothetical protein
MSSLEQGRALSMPWCATKSFLFFGQNAPEHLLQVPVGNVSSVQSVCIMFRRDSDVNDRTKDKAKIHYNPGVTGIRIEAAGISIPATRSFRYSDGSNGSVYDPEMLVLSAMSSQGNIYNAGEELDINPDTFNTEGFRFFYNFTSSEGEFFGDGLGMESASSPNLSIHLSTNAPIPTTTSIHVFVVVDSILSIQKDWISPLQTFALE